MKTFSKQNSFKKPLRTLTDVGLNMFVDTVKLRELPLLVVETNIEKSF